MRAFQREVYGKNAVSDATIRFPHFSHPSSTAGSISVFCFLQNMSANVFLIQACFRLSGFPLFPPHLAYCLTNGQGRSLLRGSSTSIGGRFVSLRGIGPTVVIHVAAGLNKQRDNRKIREGLLEARPKE